MTINITNNARTRWIMAALCTAVLLGASLGQAANTIVTGYLTGTNNWYRTNIYQMNGMVFVRSNGVLNIEAGTVIKGHNLGTDSTNIAALIVCRGAKIFAEGTAKHPIIFTADVDDTTLPDDLPIWGPTARGLWGGIVLLGQTTINGAIDAAGNAATPKYEVYEGLPDLIVGGEALFRMGGTDDNDNSGVLRYVSVRHGGAALFPNKEINGVSFGAVGRGTTVEFVESYCAADDGFEFFGGTVNTRYLVSSFNDDDSFDTDMGYRGTNQFWFAIQAPDKRNYGMELNNHPNELPQTSQNLPAADFKVYNMTIIGAGSVNNSNVNGGADHAIALRPWAGPKIYNSIFTDFNAQGILLDTQNGVTATQAVTGGFAQLHNTLWWGFTRGSGSTVIDNSITNLGRQTVATSYWTDSSLTNLITDPMLASISRTNVGKFLDPRPVSGSPALSAANVAATPNDGFLTPVDYAGAFGPNDLWINGWTALSEYGILSPVGQRTNFVTGYLTGTNNWYRTNIYQMNGMVFVRSNGVLNIEAGTVIKGHNLGTDSTNIAALIVCRGAKIFAQGTPQNPIIFTADVDDTTYFDDLPIWGPTARGLWGGIVLLGQTTINGAIDAAGNAATPKYEVYEGLPDLIVGGEALFRMGGTDDNDNSGVLRYVSVRHGGAALFPNKEINGVSFGAVGRGTTVEFVESYCAADDGFEFFGGTVNTRYLVSSFNDDDSFDTDMGYRGTNQFWFAIQAPDKRNYGMELNNHPNELPQTSQNLPAADFKVYNMTIIGAGSVNNSNVNGGADHAIALRPWAGPKIYNSIFTDFNAQGILLDTQNGVTATQAVTGGFAQLHNTLWWGFTRGSGSTVIDNSITNLGRQTVATSYWTDSSLTNLITDPQLTSISRTNVGPYLDPRPKAGSPAWDAANVAPASGGLASAGYIGAFGSVNWASDWTALGEYGILTGAGNGNPRNVETAPQTNPVPEVVISVTNRVYAAFRPDLASGYVYVDADVTAGSPVRATQRALGYREVDYKSQVPATLFFNQVTPTTNGNVITYDYSAQAAKTNQVGFWVDKDVPIVIGPDGNAYITDGHHTLAGYLSSNAPVRQIVPGLNRVFLGHVVANYYNPLSPQAPDDTWWTARAAENNAYLYGTNGNALALPADPNYASLQPIMPSVLAMPNTPSTIGAGAMLNSVERSLTWGLADGILKSGFDRAGVKILGYKKSAPGSSVDINFVEFYWADFLRNRIAWDNSKQGSPFGSTNGDASVTGAPLGFFAAVANGIALARSEVYRDQYGRGLLDYTNSALFAPNTVNWANGSYSNGLAGPSNTFNLFLLDDSTIVGDITPTALATTTNILRINTTTGMTVTNTISNLAKLFINGGTTIATTWKDATVTNTPLTFPGGTGNVTLTGTASVSESTVVSNGAFIVNGTLTGGSSVNVWGGSLRGNGSINGAVSVFAGATLAPGTSIGTLTINGPLTLAGTTTMEISKAGVVLTSDRITGITALTYGGTLTVAATGNALVAGDSFQLFVAGGYSSLFTNFNLPLLGTGLGWNTASLLIDGSISVVPAPIFTQPHLDSTPGDVTNVLGSTTFINHGLVGIGHISASALDSFGESFGSMSSMQITGFTTNNDGSYSGTLNVLPDRGYNSGAFYADYAARINQVGFTFKPYYGPTNIGGTTDLERLNAQTNQFTFGAISGVKFTYFDPITGSNSVTTGLDPGTNYATLFGQTMPYVRSYTGVASPSSIVTNTYPGINKLPLDSEALVLKGDGSGYVGDEYGESIYYFNPAKQIIGAILPPAASLPHSPSNTLNFSSAITPLNGRRNNQGFEGVSLSPDGTRLFALQQSASVQDSDAANNQRAKHTRLYVYDVSGSPTPAAPIGEYVLTLPTYKLNGNGGAVDRTCAQSEIVALDNTRFLVLSRDGNGLGNAVTNPNVYKAILLVDTAVGAPSNVAGDAARNIEGGKITIASGLLDPSITPLSWVEAVNMLNTNQLAKFNVLWDSGTNQVTKLTMGEKWEGMSLVSAKDPANPNDYFLFVGNDNDFVTGAGQMRGPDGTIVSYDAFNGYPASRIPAPLDSAYSENDTRILAYRVTITPGAAPIATLPAQLQAVSFALGGPFQLQLTGSDGAAYDIQSNTNLNTTNWITIGTVTNSGGPTPFSDYFTTNRTQKFYRAIAR